MAEDENPMSTLMERPQHAHDQVEFGTILN